jgi:signal transduction histidine kinase
LGRAFDAMAESLQQEDRLRRALVADVAHELRTPVAILQAETEALLDGVSSVSQETLTSLHDETVRLGRMVEDLQTLASAEAAGLHLERRPLDLSRVASEAADSLASRFRSAGLHLVQDLPPTFVLGDPQRLRQVVTNLLANGAKFTPAGGEVKLRVGASQDRAVLEVADSGPGIPPEEAALVWERFYRGKSGRSTAGSGIGLAVVKELAAAHGGTVHLVSPSGGGARFIVELPLATRPESDQPGLPKSPGPF